MDNVTNIEPADNEERLLKGILEGDESTNIEPRNNKERLLKAILENGGGGGGATSVTLAASGDNLSGDISLADLKTALSKGVVLLSFPTEGNADERVAAEYTDDSTNGLRIGVFSEDEYIVYSVVDDGNDGVTLTVGSGGITKLKAKYVATDAMEGVQIMGAIQNFVQAAMVSQTFTYNQTPVSLSTLVNKMLNAFDEGYQGVYMALSDFLIPITALSSHALQFHVIYPVQAAGVASMDIMLTATAVTITGFYVAVS